MSISREDIKRAQTILRFWLTEAKAQKKQSAIEDVKHLKRVLDGLTK